MGLILAGSAGAASHDDWVPGERSDLIFLFCFHIEAITAKSKSPLEHKIIILLLFLAFLVQRVLCCIADLLRFIHRTWPSISMNRNFC